jgi:glutaconate CoA-transferase, subunit A
MSDKRATVDDALSELRSSMTIGIGGWGSRRKPMALVRAICRSDLKDLTVVAYGGPDVGLLCATGKVRRVVCGFVTLDSIALEPHWRAARQEGRVELTELDEGMFYLGLQAAAWRVPFLPTRAGLGSGVLEVNPDLRTVRSPYDSGSFAHPEGGIELVAAPALRLDAALVHANRADQAGNAQFLGPDPFFDDVMLGAAERRIVSAERVVPQGDLPLEGPLHSVAVHRMMTDAIVEIPGGAHFTSCPPDYGRDEQLQRAYAAAARDPEAWEAFRARYVDVDEATYRAAVAEEGTGR